MKPLNHKERSDLFVKFLLLFFLSVGIVAFAMFFDSQLPLQMSEEQRSKLNAYSNYVRSEERILNRMNSMDTSLSLLGTSNQAPEVLSKQVADNIFELKKTGGDDTSNIRVLNAIGNVYSNYLRDKQQWRRLQEEKMDGNKELAKLKEDLKACRDEKNAMVSGGAKSGIE